MNLRLKMYRHSLLLMTFTYASLLLSAVISENCWEIRPQFNAFLFFVVSILIKLLPGLHARLTKEHQYKFRIFTVSPNPKLFINLFYFLALLVRFSEKG